MINLGAPKFAFGPDQVDELALSLPTSPYTKSLSATGGDLEGDSGVRASYVIRRDEFLNFQIRFYETEWPAIVAWIDTVMDGQQFLFFPQKSDEESYFVTLESPAVGTKYEPTPDGNYPRVLFLAIILRAPNFDSPATAIREFQEDFETPQHTVVHASTTRRPDAVSFDYLRAAALGPTAIADVTLGSAIRKWYVRAFGNTVFIARANPTNTDWEAEAVLFTYANSVADPINELDFAFTQAGTVVVCAERPTGLWVYWFDPTVPGNTFVNLGVGRSPKCLLDNLDSSAPNTDVLIFYIQEAAGPEGQGAICFRVQSERYAIEHLTPILGGMDLEVVSGDPDIHELTGEGISGVTGEEVEGTFRITVPQELNVNGIFHPPAPHFGETLGDWQLADFDVFSYRVVWEFSKPVRSVSISQFYPTSTSPGFVAPGGMFVAAVKEREDFHGIGGAVYDAAAFALFTPTEWMPPPGFGDGPYSTTVTVNEGFRFLVVDSPIRLAFGYTHINLAPTFVATFDGNIGGIITLPPIEDMFVEDAVKTIDGRVMVIYSGRDELHGTYMIQKLISGLYPFFPPADDMKALNIDFFGGELKTVLLIVEPPGTSPTQLPDVFAMPDENLADVFNLTMQDGGTLIDNTELVFPEGSTVPPTVPVGRFAFHTIDDLLQALNLTLQSGTIVSNVMVVIPAGTSVPPNVEAVFFDTVADVGRNVDVLNVTMQNGGTLITIVIVYVASQVFDPDGADPLNLTLQSGTLV